jgi:hypothetical protein
VLRREAQPARISVRLISPIGQLATGAVGGPSIVIAAVGCDPPLQLDRHDPSTPLIQAAFSRLAPIWFRAALAPT